MSVFLRGIKVLEQQTNLIPPVQCDSAVPVAIGIAPVNTGQAENALAPQIAFSYEEAVNKIGYTSNPEKYPLAQLTKAAFELYNVAPVIYINVLDPSRHKEGVTGFQIEVAGNTAEIPCEGVLLDSIQVSSEDGSVQYQPGTDYTAQFTETGTAELTLPESGGIFGLEEKLTVSFDQLDPSQVTVNDVLAGIRKVKEIYPRFETVPGVLLAPGFSHLPEVYFALTAQCENLGGLFKCTVLADVDTKECDTYTKINGWKNQNSFTNPHSVLLYPKCRVGGHIFWMSSLLAPLIAYTDTQYNNIPAVSPSNKPLKISGLCGDSGAEIIMDMEQANLLNGQGVATAINLNGWRFWGDRTAAYPSNTDIKDVMLPVRRMFDWQSNVFTLTYFQKVDNPANYRLIESIVDSENIRLGGLKAAGYLADAKMIFRLSDNPETSLIDGKIVLHQMFTPYPAAECIINTLEYDVNALRDSFSGVSS